MGILANGFIVSVPFGLFVFVVNLFISEKGSDDE